MEILLNRARANPLPLVALAAGGIILFYATRYWRTRIRTEIEDPVLLPEPEEVIERESA